MKGETIFYQQQIFLSTVMQSGDIRTMLNLATLAKEPYRVILARLTIFPIEFKSFISFGVIAALDGL